jgi:hypothetical protein
MPLENKSTGRQKRIIAVAGKYPNYIFHLLALAKIRFDSKYAVIYRDSALPDDIAYMKKCRDSLSIGMRSGGELTFIVGLPIYFEIDSKDDIGEFFSLLESGFQTDNFRPFFARYHSFIERLSDWFPLNERDLIELRQYRERIAELGRITLRNYDSFEDNVWEIERKKLLPVSSRINSYFDKGNVISKWEDLTRSVFKSDVCNIVLCSAIKNGPNANSIGYDCIVFYHDMRFDELIQLISHEVGTHLLIGVYRQVLASGKFEPESLYRAYECMAKFYNTMILGDNKLLYKMPDFHDDEYLKIYKDIYKNNRKITAQELLIHGLNRFQSS